MFREACLVLENKKVAPGHFVLKMRSKSISRNARPGQFVEVLCSQDSDPLLPRPFSFLDCDSKSFSLLYQVVGKGTDLLSKVKKNDKLRILGPLGNGFSLRSSLRGAEGDEAISKTGLLGFAGNDILLVGGGVGIPPLYHLAKTAKNKNTQVFLGARHKSLLLCEKDFKKLKVGLHLATDDGSRGKKGFVTGILEDFLQKNDLSQAHIYTCGPTPMLKAVSMIAQKYQVPCQVSVEVPMACGFGACLGCAITVRQGTEAPEHQKNQEKYRFAIACKEGPVFCGEKIVWE
jgi:dihydroorotate dehydrogenase electron transfer subunit